MTQKIRMWEVNQNTPSEIPSNEIGREEDLHKWLKNDISMLDPALLVIGSKVRTDSGKEIDLLCLDSTGDLVVVELKKGQTQRDVTAQALDYASWVRDLSYERITGIAAAYLGSKDSLDQSFEEKFGDSLPDTLNQGHRSLIVAEEMDDSTERIVRYLADMGVPINVATVQHFRTQDGRELLAQVFLIEPDLDTPIRQTSSHRYRYVTAPEMQALAAERGVEELYSHFRAEASGILAASSFGKSRVGFQVKLEGRTLAVLVIDVGESDKDNGIRFRLNGRRLMEAFKLNIDQFGTCLPKNVEGMSPAEWKGASKQEIANWYGFKGYFRTTDEIDKFLGLLKGPQA